MKTVHLLSKEKDKITLVRIKDKKVKTITIDTKLLTVCYRWESKSFKVSSNMYEAISLQTYNDIKKDYENNSHFKKIVL